MKLVTYSIENEDERLGFLHLDKIIDMEDFGNLANFPLPNTMLDFIDLGIEIVDEVESLIEEMSEQEMNALAIDLNKIKWCAPIPKPLKNIFGIGLNYTEHVAESARSLDTSHELPQKPVIFSKPPTAVIGQGDEILLNRNITNQLDWEAELAVVIGKYGKNVTKEKAMDYVYGYTIINDISARDCRRAGQWIVSKGQDTFAPMGPILVTKNEIEDPHQLGITLTVNGVEKQNGNTQFMLFRIPDLIEDLSTVFTLEPGDIIATGTPAGVGAGRTPQEWLQNGDVVRASVEKIGTLENTVREI